MMIVCCHPEHNPDLLVDVLAHFEFETELIISVWRNIQSSTSEDGLGLQDELLRHIAGNLLRLESCVAANLGISFLTEARGKTSQLC